MKSALFIPVLACLLLAGCSHRPSPEFRHMLRTYFSTADRAVEAKDRQELIERTRDLQAQDGELTSAWPKGWNEDDSFRLAWLNGKLVDSYSHWGDGYEANARARGEIEEAKRLLRDLEKRLRDQVRE